MLYNLEVGYTKADGTSDKVSVNNATDPDFIGYAMKCIPEGGTYSEMVITFLENVNQESFNVDIGEDTSCGGKFSGSINNSASKDLTFPQQIIIK
jgi:hypothetical protein